MILNGCLSEIKVPAFCSETRTYTVLNKIYIMIVGNDYLKGKANAVNHQPIWPCVEGEWAKSNNEWDGWPLMTV